MSRKMAPSPLVSMAIATLTWIAAPSLSQAATQSLSPNVEQEPGAVDDQVAQLFYPPVNEDQQALMVLGQGEASAPADIAEVEFSFTNYDPYAVPEEGLLLFNDTSAQAPPSLQAQATPGDPPTLTETQLQPVVDALVAAGIPSESIEVSIVPGSPNVYPYTTDRGSVSFDLDAPSQEQIKQAVDGVNEAIADSEEIFLQNLSVQYSVNDCTELEQDVYQDAISDARNRATAIATAMGVELAAVPSVAESPFNFFSPACGSTAQPSPYNPFGLGASYYDPEAPAEVLVRRDIFVTFPIR
ncbi:SIMPL domain-containing protein [Leptolyngbya sp. FACHB-671]|uniref:SIMPL domain-containing protein n=1 Tax=Leptolyngbya sp. FACHB-671 TaxID=2692812 RepID=UPI00168980F9|nr:SIMPL domain-containing protein [Leptolyngbya sp. FACHB-671]MBD2070950.1 SIMPL domain-containing protein [Leptolyngbya sp. FACHB-671]